MLLGLLLRAFQHCRWGQRFGGLQREILNVACDSVWTLLGAAYHFGRRFEDLLAFKLAALNNFGQCADSLNNQRSLGLEPLLAIEVKGMEPLRLSRSLHRSLSVE